MTGDGFITVTSPPPLVDADALAKISEQFPSDKIGLLPKTTCRDCVKKICDRHNKSRCPECNAWVSTQHIHIEYVGHAEITDRLLRLDPTWGWEPFALDSQGLPAINRNGNINELWIRLTFAGVTRIGVGTVAANKNEATKELIGDAIRNAAMRFGAALNLWAKSDIHAVQSAPEASSSEFATEAISEDQVAAISALFDRIADQKERTRAKVEWWRSLGMDHTLDWTPKHRYQAVYDSAETAALAADAVPDGGLVEEARAAARALSMDQIRGYAETVGCALPANKPKHVALLALGEHTGTSPGEVAEAVVDIGEAQ